MTICILCGGVGSRIFPYSTKKKPKQFLVFKKNKTQLENSYKLLSKITKEIYFITNIEYKAQTYKLFPKIDKKYFIFENKRKGTYFAAKNALEHLSKKCSYFDKNTNVLFFHCDHFIQHTFSFIKDVKKMFNLALEKNKIVIGLKKSNEPIADRGYIFAKNKQKYFQIEKFLEKPPVNLINKIYKKTYWNEGMFIINLKNIKTNKQYEKIEDLYNKNNTIGYKINFEWIDVGSFINIYKICKKNFNQNAFIGSKIFVDNCEKCLIINTTNSIFKIKNQCSRIIIKNKEGIHNKPLNI